MKGRVKVAVAGALVASVLERRDGVYANTPATDLFLDRRKPSYIGGLAGTIAFGSGNSLQERDLTGYQNEAKSGVPLFALSTPPARATSQADRDQPWRNVRSQKIPYAAPLLPARDLAVQAPSPRRTSTWVNFDLPGVAPVFEEYVRASGWESRLPRDFFTTPPPVDLSRWGTSSTTGISTRSGCSSPRPTRRCRRGVP